MESTVKIWVTKSNFSSIQKGSYPTDFLTTPPTHISEYVEMNVGMSTLVEWVSKHKAEGSKSSGKTILND